MANREYAAIKAMQVSLVDSSRDSAAGITEGPGQLTD
jgi:hypothetical protein